MGYYVGDYYMAGGLFKRLARGVTRGVRGIVRLHGTAAARMLSGGRTSNLRSAAVESIGRAASFSGAGGTVGRVASMFSPTAAPAGLPVDGTPPLAEATSAASTNTEDSEGMMQLLLALLLSRAR